MSKQKKPIMCCAPLCDKKALHKVYAIGDAGAFYGMLCDAHYKNLKSCFNAHYWQVAYLRAVTVKDLAKE